MANRKLRNGKTDIEGLAQWVGRKCRNHDPISERKGRARPDVGIVNSAERNTVIYESQGRTFRITVEEIEEAEVADEQLVPVGY